MALPHTYRWIPIQVSQCLTRELSYVSVLIQHNPIDRLHYIIQAISCHAYELGGLFSNMG